MFAVYFVQTVFSTFLIKVKSYMEVGVGRKINITRGLIEGHEILGIRR